MPGKVRGLRKLNRIMKINLLKFLLRIAAIFYLIGAAVHLFGLTVFPWYVHQLYSPYHDSLISVFCIFLSLLLFIVAKDPIKYKEIVRVIIIGFLLISLFSVLIILKVDFTALGAPDKKLQTIIEGIFGLIYSGVLLYSQRD